MTRTIQTAEPRESFTTADEAVQTYDQLVEPARQRFASTRGIAGMVSPGTGPRRMVAFLLHFSALSVPITEPVESWIRCAGERCEALGLQKFGRALRGHARAEAGHQQYHIDDFVNLTRFWNSRWSPPVDTAAIRAHGVSPGGGRYSRLHEETIAGPAPFCQFAIEYEIERLPVQYGRRFVENCVALLGRDILDCMSFTTSHIEFDVGHTKFNARFLGDMIVECPGRLALLGEAGTAALDTFGEHLADCMRLAESFESQQ